MCCHWWKDPNSRQYNPELTPLKLFSFSFFSRWRKNLYIREEKLSPEHTAAVFAAGFLMLCWAWLRGTTAAILEPPSWSRHWDGAAAILGRFLRCDGRHFEVVPKVRRPPFWGGSWGVDIVVSGRPLRCGNLHACWKSLFWELEGWQRKAR